MGLRAFVTTFNGYLTNLDMSYCCVNEARWIRSTCTGSIFLFSLDAGGFSAVASSGRRNDFAGRTRVLRCPLHGDIHTSAPHILSCHAEQNVERSCRNIFVIVGLRFVSKLSEESILRDDVVVSSNSGNVVEAGCSGSSVITTCIFYAVFM